MQIILNSDNPADAALIAKLFPAPEPLVFVPQTAEESEPQRACDLAATLDSAGLPWDGRIHSESRALVADGTWRKRRGVSPETVKQVEDELQGVAPASVPPPPAAVAVPAAAVTPPPPPVAPPAAPASRGMADLSAALGSGRIQLLDLLEKAKEHGAADVLALASDPDALAAVVAHYEALGAFQ